MDEQNPHGFSNSPLNSNNCDQDDLIFSQSYNVFNATHMNPQIPPLSNPLFSNLSHSSPSNHAQNNYAFCPSSFIPHVQQQYSFQGLMNPPLSSFETQTPISSKKKGRKQKNTSNSQRKNSEVQPLRRNWSKEEDVALTKAWLHISIDPIVGRDQSSNTLWNRIHIAWKDFLGEDFVENRPINGLACRWSTIQGAVNKFNGIYEQVERSPRSGANVDDLKRDAHRVYKEMSVDNKPFLFEHCWVECVKNAKWCLTTTSSKRQKSSKGSPPIPNSSSPTNSSSIPNDVELIDVSTLGKDEDVRPPGRNASKEKKKMHVQDKGVAEVLSKLQVSLQQQFDHNREELEFKEKELALKTENTLTMKKDHELRELTTKKELEFKEKELALKEKAQRRRDQQKVLNQDLSKLVPVAREAMEKMQERILKEWEEDFGI